MNTQARQLPQQLRGMVTELKDGISENIHLACNIIATTPAYPWPEVAYEFYTQCTMASAYGLLHQYNLQLEVELKEGQVERLVDKLKQAAFDILIEDLKANGQI